MGGAMRISELIWQQWRKPCISAFLLIYIYSITLYLTLPCPPRDALLQPVKQVVDYIGLWQFWTMFSPNPPVANIDLDAIVSYSDGSREVWHFPQVEKMSILERIPKERYRKYGFDHLNWDEDKLMRPDFARWVARNHTKEGKQPTRVQLERHFALIPPARQGLGKPAPPHSISYIFFDYNVTPDDLR